MPKLDCRLPAVLNNFDLLRLLLALVVVGYHLWVLTRETVFSMLPKFLNAELAVDGFFVVSGFLIAMSFEKSRSIKQYFEKRVCRIYPAYLTVIILPAILLVIFSVVSAREYFGGEWVKYIVSNLFLLNFLSPELPGLFDENRIQAVNGALWTIKIEVMFYLLLPLLVLLMRRLGHWQVMLTVYAGSILYSAGMQWMASHEGGSFYLILERQLPGQLAFFMAGSLLFFYFDRFYSYRFPLLLIAACGFLAAREWQFLYPIYPMMLAILVISFATTLKYLGNWGRWGDFSYGIYIWHFPLIQLLIATGIVAASPYLTLLILFGGVFTMAFLSWHFIERPFLNRASHYRQAEKI